MKTHKERWNVKKNLEHVHKRPRKSFYKNKQKINEYAGIPVVSHWATAAAAADDAVAQPRT